jgi:two-component system NtrC family sensor kinase
VLPKPEPSRQARNFLTVMSVLFLAVLLLSLFFDLKTTRQRYEELATAVGRSIFQQLVAVRTWSTQHGGVYVETPQKLRLAPHMEGLSTEAITNDGKVLTRVHPEYITRLISDILTRERGVRIGVTSLKLTNMDNTPDPWETGALHAFEKGKGEQFTVAGSGESAIFRYMAPLRTEEACLGCHGRQGYKLGDIRGGMSVSFSYVPFQKAATKNNRQIYAVHGVFFLVGLALIYFLGRKLIGGIVDLQEASSRIKRLEGMLPICAGCKKIRVEGADPVKQESWIPVEVFIRDRTDAEFSHSFCPECLTRLYGWKDKE